MRANAFTIAALCLALLAGCSSEEPTFGPPVRSEPGPASGALPTGPPLGTITLTSGTAQVTVSGDFEANGTFEGISTPAIYQPLPGAVAVTWGDRGLAIIGSLHLGAQATIAGLSLSLSVPVDTGTVALSSAGGECTITVDAADQRSFSGSFDCGELVTGDGLTLAATGTFQASG
jgi:hypothetical protein